MGADDGISNWSPHSLLEPLVEYCLMQHVLVGAGRRQLQAARFNTGPVTGGCHFEIWVSPMGSVQMVPYSDYTHQYFDGAELAAALLVP